MNTFQDGQKYVMNTYNRFPITLEKGEGMYVYDENGKKYLDFVAGIAVNSLGHGDKELAEAISKQAMQMLHVSNLYWTKPQVSLAKKLVEEGCFDKAFFCNSGAEAIEGALKISRKYGNKTGRSEIITMLHSFHGRTFGAVTATGQPHYQEGLGELLPNVKYAEYNNIESLKNTISDKTCAVVLEPVQGEGGIIPATKEYLEEVRKICDEKDIVLVFDEIQCGVGRLGTFYAYQTFGVEPDVLCMAKGIAGGVPCGVLMAKQKIADSFKPGDHASTFGGNPLATAAGNVVFDKLKGGILDNVKAQGEYLTSCLKELQKDFSVIKEVRGIGLMQGIELEVDVAPVVKECIENGLLLVNAGKRVIRFVPSLIVSKENIDDAMKIVRNALSNIK